MTMVTHCLGDCKTISFCTSLVYTNFIHFSDCDVCLQISDVREKFVSEDTLDCTFLKRLRSFKTSFSCSRQKRPKMERKGRVMRSPFGTRFSLLTVVYIFNTFVFFWDKLFFLIDLHEVTTMCKYLMGVFHP